MHPSRFCGGKPASCWSWCGPCMGIPAAPTIRAAQPFNLGLDLFYDIIYNIYNIYTTTIYIYIIIYIKYIYILLLYPYYIYTYIPLQPYKIIIYNTYHRTVQVCTYGGMAGNEGGGEAGSLLNPSNTPVTTSNHSHHRQEGKACCYHVGHLYSW